jgi:hypothetical protein
MVVEVNVVSWRGRKNFRLMIIGKYSGRNGYEDKV